MSTYRTFILVFALVSALARPALARPGDGVTMGRLTLHPYIDVSVTYDSNAQRLAQPVDEAESAAEPVVGDAEDPLDPVFLEESDTYYEIRGGSSLLWFDDDWALSGSVWAFLRRYQDLDLEDEEGFGERFAFARGDRDRLAIGLFQSFERRFDFNLDALEGDPSSPTLTLTSPGPAGELDLEEELIRVQSERDLFSFGVDAGRTLRQIFELDAGYAYTETDYLDSRLFGDSRHTLSFSLGRALTSKTAAFVQGSYGEEDNENYVDAVPYYQVLAGLRSAATAKISYNVGVGYQEYDTAETRPVVLEDGTTVLNDGTRILVDGSVLPPEPRRNPVTGELIEEGPPPDGSQGGIAYNAGLTWRPTHKLFFGLSGRNEYSSSSTGDQREVNLAQFSARYSPSGPFQVSVRVGYRDEQAVNDTLVIDDEGNESRINEERETLTAGGRISFRPRRRGYELYADVTYEDIQSNLEQQSYDRLRVGGGLRATY